MVYFAADDVGEPGKANLDKIKIAGSDDKVAMLAQFNPSGNTQTTRYWLRNGTHLEEDVVERLSNVETGNPKSLVDFVDWGIDHAPAEHYLLVLWGHGDGWQTEDNAGRAAGRTVQRKIDVEKMKRFLKSAGFDREDIDSVPKGQLEKLLQTLVLLPDWVVRDMRSPDIMDGKELKEALMKVSQKKLGGAKIDILGMDSCLMAMVEVGYQVRDSVRFMVACEEVEPIESWPYDFILSELKNHSDMNPEQFAQVIVRKYTISYVEKKQFVTQSACDLSKAYALGRAISTLAEKLEKALDDPQLRTNVMMARAMAQTYYVKDYVDLYNFCDILASLIDDDKDAISVDCDDVKTLISKHPRKLMPDEGSFIPVHAYYGYSLKDSHGASIYFPCRDFSASYNGLDFARETSWGSFITRFAGLVPPTRIDEAPADSEIVVTESHLSIQAGDPRLGPGPGDPVQIPADPFGPLVKPAGSNLRHNDKASPEQTIYAHDPNERTSPFEPPITPRGLRRD
jgi:hypothetical protein